MEEEINDSPDMLMLEDDGKKKIWNPYTYKFGNTAITMPNSATHHDHVGNTTGKNIFNKELLMRNILKNNKEIQMVAAQKRKHDEEENNIQQRRRQNSFDIFNELEAETGNKQVNEIKITDGSSKKDIDKNKASTSNTNNSDKNNIKINTNKQNIDKVNGKSFCPPIFIKGLSVKDIQKHLLELPKDIKFKYIILPGNRIKLFVNDAKIHRNIIDDLRDMGIESYSFAPREEKIVSVLLKGVDHNFTCAEITQALADQLGNEVNILKVTPFSTTKSKKHNKPLNIFVVRLKCYKDVEKISKIKYVLHQRISWDKIRKQGAIRCYRCQHFGHGSEYCTRTTVCVFCSGKHDVAVCPEVKNKIESDADVLPTCVNCNQRHTASYKGCPAYIKYVQKREMLKEKAKKSLKAREEFVSKSVNNFVKGNISFAEMAKSGLHTSIPHNINRTHSNMEKPSPQPDTSNNATLQNFLNETKSLFNRSFTELIKEIRQFWPKYLSLASQEEKITAYLEFLTSIVV